MLCVGICGRAALVYLSRSRLPLSTLPLGSARPPAHL